MLPESGDGSHLGFFVELEIESNLTYVHSLWDFRENEGTMRKHSSNETESDRRECKKM